LTESPMNSQGLCSMQPVDDKQPKWQCDLTVLWRGLQWHLQNCRIVSECLRNILQKATSLGFITPLGTVLREFVSDEIKGPLPLPVSRQLQFCTSVQKTHNCPKLSSTERSNSLVCGENEFR